MKIKWICLFIVPVFFISIDQAYSAESTVTATFEGDIENFGVLQRAIENADAVTAKAAFLQIAQKKSAAEGEPTRWHESLRILMKSSYLRFQSDCAGAALLLQPLLNQDNPFQKIIVKDYIECGIEAGLIDAVSYYLKNLPSGKRLIEQDKIKKYEREIATQYLTLGHFNKAEMYLLSDPFLIFDPLLSRSTADEWEDFLCKNPQIFQKIQAKLTVQESRAFGQTLFRRLGALPDIKEYVLSIGDIWKEKFVTLSSIQEIENHFEFLTRLREYRMAKDLFSFQERKNPEVSSSPQILLHLGRVYNALNQPDMAKESYKKIVKEFPQSALAKQARQRLMTSLMYHKDYDAAYQLASAISREQKNTEVVFTKFWSRVRARKWKELLNDSRSLGASKKFFPSSFLIYWEAKALEKSGLISESLKKYTELLTDYPLSFHGLIVRLNAAKPFPKAPNSLEIFPKKAEQPLSLDPPSQIKDSPGLAYVSTLTKNGLHEHACLILRELQKQISTQQTALDFANKANLCFDYKLAMAIIRKWFPNLNPNKYKGSELIKAVSENRDVFKIAYPRAYSAIVENESKKQDVHPHIIWSIMRQESVFDPKIESQVGAKGLLQMMPITGYKVASYLSERDFLPSDLEIPNINIPFGIWYLKRMINYYKGNIILAIAAYNAGPIAVDRWINQNPNLEIDEFVDNIPFQETKNYVHKVVSNILYYNQIYTDQKYDVDLSLLKNLPVKRDNIELF